MSVLLSVLFLVLYLALNAFIIVMWVRLIFDFVTTYNRGWRPSGPGLVIAEIAYTITDPPIKLVRRVVRPVRFGAAALDLAPLIVIVTAFVLAYVCARFL